jgi:hypothetical protein
MKATPARAFLVGLGLVLSGYPGQMMVKAAEEAAPMVVVEKTDLDPRSDFNKTVRSAMLDRIYTMVGIDAPKEDRFYKSVMKAYSLGALIRIPLAPGQRDLTWDQIKALKAAFEEPRMQSLRLDASCELIVLGFADTAEESVDNVYLSKDRADFVKRVLRNNLGIANVLFTLPMGGPPLFDPKRTTREYAVEIWLLGTLEHGEKEVATGR